VYFRRILLVATTGKEHLQLKTKLNRNGVTDKTVSCFSSNEARRMLTEEDFDLIIIKAPLSDESGEFFALFATKKSKAQIILFVRNSYMKQMATKVGEQGVLVLGDHIDDFMFYQTLSIAFSINVKLSGIHNENSRLRKRLEEIKVVNRAKFLLVEHMSYTEENAHKYIEKSAMDRRISKTSVCKEIIEKIENLE
jgi:response regulator NasT